MKVKIKKASFHRNGIGGAGFYAIIFEDEEYGLMIASLFDEPGHCAVYNISELEKENIEFANGNSWRGDNYEEKLRPLIDEYFINNPSDRIGPFSFNANIFKNVDDLIEKE